MSHIYTKYLYSYFTLFCFSFYIISWSQCLLLLSTSCQDTQFKGGKIIYLYRETYAGSQYSYESHSLSRKFLLFFFFCDQREEIYRERALFLKCPQTWGQAGWCFFCERQPWGHCSQRMRWFRILRGRKGNQWGKERKNWNVNFIKLNGKVKTYNGN